MLGKLLLLFGILGALWFMPGIMLGALVLYPPQPFPLAPLLGALWRGVGSGGWPFS
jgi:hypothetical protein